MNLVRSAIKLGHRAGIQNDRDHTDAWEMNANLAQHQNRPEGRPTNVGANLHGSRLRANGPERVSLGQRKGRKGKSR